METARGSGILVFTETDQGKIHPVSLELLSEAAKLNSQTGEKLYAVVIGKVTEESKEQFRESGVDKAWIYETETLFQTDLYGNALEACIRECRPASVLIGGTWEGRALASGAAVSLGTGITADCTALTLDENKNLVQTRPAFGGNIMASIMTKYPHIQIATVRPHVFARENRNGKAETEFVFREAEVLSGGICILETREIDKNKGIDEYDLVIAAGRGIRKKEDLELVSKLAENLGGALASSRGLVEKGWIKADRQIGLSGRTITPKCLITLGVSGTVQFAAGMKNAGNIISVNTDPECRIFDFAHHPICADLYEVVPQLEKIYKNEWV